MLTVWLWASSKYKKKSGRLPNSWQAGKYLIDRAGEILL
jgi:hypothetical protein